MKVKLSLPIQFRSLSVSICVATLLAGCGGGSSDPGPNMVGSNENSNSADSGTLADPTTTSGLEGEWELCAGTERSRRQIYTFTSNSWTRTLEDFDNGDCSGMPIFVGGLLGGSYELVGESTSEEGLAVQEINLTENNIGGDPLPERTTYIIVYTEIPNQITFGVGSISSGTSGNSPEERATSINFDVTYTRR